MSIPYLVIEGNIGAGKTSLAKKISRETNARLILEQFNDNPFLPKFYDDKERYAFPVELTFLADRYQQLKNEIEQKDLFQTNTVSDYYFVKSLIFSRKTLKDDEYSLYTRLFDIIQQQLTLPDLYVFLHLETDRLLQNIKKRGRDYEKSITHEYLENITKSYYDFMKNQSKLKILIIDCNNIDFVNSSNDYTKIKNVIFASDYKPGINRILL